MLVTRCLLRRSQDAIFRMHKGVVSCKNVISFKDMKAETKRLAFRRLHFRITFLVWNFILWIKLNQWNLFPWVLLTKHQRGLAPRRPRAIIWTNDCIVYRRRICVNKLRKVILLWSIRSVLFHGNWSCIDLAKSLFQNYWIFFQR